jgi:NTE family protein
MDDLASTGIVPANIAASLARAPLFADLDRQTRASVAGKLTHVGLPGGTALFRAGEATDALYIVLNGRLAVRAPGPAGGLLIAEIGADDIVGELSLIGQRRRSNDVIALRDSELLRLDRVEFERLTREHPEALDGLMHTIVERLGAPPRARPRRPRTLAILPRSADEPGLASLLDRFVDGLSTALRDAGARVRITGPADAERSAGWFNELEAHSDYVLYRGERCDDAWAGLCQRQADVVIEVARLYDEPQASRLKLDNGEGSLPRRRELVLLREEGDLPKPGSTAPWLDVSPDVAHHHAHVDSVRDLQRLARLMTGRAVGVVMAGGGARGFAHIGVVKALREANVPIDLLGGASMGAIVAAGVAAGWTNEEMHERFTRAFVESNPLTDYQIPFVSMFAGRRVTARLRAAFGDLDLEDLPIGMYCVSANLTTAMGELHRRGRAVRRLRSTVAIPGVLPPVVEKGQVLVDGGVLENFPVSPMRELGRGPVIGIDIETGGALAAGADVVEPWSPSEFIRRLIWRRDQTLPFPSIVRILLRSALVASSHRAAEQRKLVDLLILPPMKDFDLLDWSSFDRAIDAGYNAARMALEQIRDTELAGKLIWPE